MSGECDLGALLRGMKPELQPGVFVFCTLPPGENLTAIAPVLKFRDAEGLTLVVEQDEAERAGLVSQFPSRQITLTVHSALDAVGFLAAVATCLARAGISANPVSAFYHDHLFVPCDRADEAVKLLWDLAQTATTQG